MSPVRARSPTLDFLALRANRLCSGSRCQRKKFPRRAATPRGIGPSVAPAVFTGGLFSMPHFPKPFFRKPRNRWAVEIDGKQFNLGPDEEEAFRRYYELMDQRS